MPTSKSVLNNSPTRPPAQTPSQIEKTPVESAKINVLAGSEKTASHLRMGVRATLPRPPDSMLHPRGRRPNKLGWWHYGWGGGAFSKRNKYTIAQRAAPKTSDVLPRQLLAQVRGANATAPPQPEGNQIGSRVGGIDACPGSGHQQQAVAVKEESAKAASFVCRAVVAAVKRVSSAAAGSKSLFVKGLRRWWAMKKRISTGRSGSPATAASAPSSSVHSGGEAQICGNTDHADMNQVTVSAGHEPWGGILWHSNADTDLPISAPNPAEAIITQSGLITPKTPIVAADIAEDRTLCNFFCACDDRVVELCSHDRIADKQSGVAELQIRSAKQSCRVAGFQSCRAVEATERQSCRVTEAQSNIVAKLESLDSQTPQLGNSIPHESQKIDPRAKGWKPNAAEITKQITDQQKRVGLPTARSALISCTGVRAVGARSPPQAARRRNVRGCGCSKGRCNGDDDDREGGGGEGEGASGETCGKGGEREEKVICKRTDAGQGSRPEFFIGESQSGRKLRSPHAKTEKRNELTTRGWRFPPGRSQPERGAAHDRLFLVEGLGIGGLLCFREPSDSTVRKGRADGGERNPPLPPRIWQTQPIRPTTGAQPSHTHNPAHGRRPFAALHGRVLCGTRACAEMRAWAKGVVATIADRKPRSSCNGVAGTAGALALTQHDLIGGTEPATHLPMRPQWLYKSAVSGAVSESVPASCCCWLDRMSVCPSSQPLSHTIASKDKYTTGTGLNSDKVETVMGVPSASRRHRCEGSIHNQSNLYFNPALGCRTPPRPLLLYTFDRLSILPVHPSQRVAEAGRRQIAPPERRSPRPARIIARRAGSPDLERLLVTFLEANTEELALTADAPAPSLLDFAVPHGFLDLARLLLTHGAYPNRRGTPWILTLGTWRTNTRRHREARGETGTGRLDRPRRTASCWKPTITSPRGCSGAGFARVDVDAVRLALALGVEPHDNSTAKMMVTLEERFEESQRRRLVACGRLVLAGRSCLA
ncbi:hypothetical protein DFJ73DRAFT_966283 [Zopfochytrium polystomum]|nr:hypothetical protein DFJ73DRAFT_966283 [Zopfochytrium polystomum]